MTRVAHVQRGVVLLKYLYRYLSQIRYLRFLNLNVETETESFLCVYSMKPV